MGKRQNLSDAGNRPDQQAAPLAVVWTPYDFWVGGEWSHCGMDIFTLVVAPPAGPPAPTRQAGFDAGTSAG